MLTGRCEQCPRTAAGLTGPCIAEHTGNRAYCGAVAAGDEHLIAATLAWQPPPPTVAVTPYGQEPPPPPTPGPVAAAIRPAVAAVRAKFARMKACPHWIKSTSCGCGVNECALGRGDRGRVAHADCFACPELPKAT